MDDQDVEHRRRSGGAWRLLLALCLVLVGLGGTLLQQPAASAASQFARRGGTQPVQTGTQTSTGTVVKPLLAGSLSFTGVPSTVPVGTSFSMTLTGPTNTYSGTVNFTSSDTNSPVLPGTTTFTGSVLLNFTLNTPGTQTITATDGNGFTGVATITVIGPATQFSVSAPSTATAGTAVTFTITPEDSQGQVATGYTGTVTFASSDTQATVPSDYTFTSGAQKSFQVTFRTPGTQTITATDVNHSTITGTSGNVTVSSQSTSGLLSISPSSAQPGTLVSATGCGYTTSDTLSLSYSASSSPTGATPLSLVGSPSNPSTGCYAVQFYAPTPPSVGTYYLFLTGSSSGTVDSGTIYLYTSTTGTASLTASPTTQAPGGVVSLYGTGFTSSSYVTVNAFGTSQTIGLTSGNFNGSVTVPIGTATGSYSITAQGNSGQYATATVYVSGSIYGTASLTASPSTQSPGGVVTLYGSGFTSSSYVTVSAFGTSQTMYLTSGSFTGSVTVPAGTATGSYSITAQGNGGQYATATVYVSGSIYGTASLSLTPTTQAPGGVVTLYGSGFSSSSYVTVTAFNTSQTVYLTSGSFTGSVTVPAGTATGSYSITAQGNGGQYATATLYVSGTGTATLVATPSTVMPGSTFTLTGSGFGYSATVTVSAFGTTQTAYTVAGTFSATLTVPAGTPAGSYTITAVDNTGMSGSTTVTVGTGVATLLTAPTSAAPNSTVSVTGSGFSSNVSVTLTAFGMTQTLYTLNGSFTASVTVPAGTAAGVYTFSAVDSSGRSGSTTETVTTNTGTLVASPSSVSPNTTLAVSGSGFASSASVTVTAFGMTQTAYTVGGAFTVSLTVPAGTAAGSYTITAVDSTGISGSATVTVTSSGTLQLSTASGTPGQTITVTGSGFSANEQVGLSLSTSSTPPISIGGTSMAVTAGAGGTFSAQYVVPAVSPGSYYVLARGQTSGTTAIIAFSVLQGTTTTSTATLPSVSTAATTRYFASGYTGTASSNGKDNSNEVLYLYNPGSTSSYVTTTYAVYDPATGAHSTVTEQNTVAAGATVSRSVNADVGSNKMVSATVNASAAIVAEEVVSRTTATGATLDTSSSLGTTTPGTTWYLAEGYTGITFQEYLTIYNPGTTAVQAQVQYLPTDTAMPAPVSETIPAQSQVTINVRSQYNGLEPHGSKEIAIKVTANSPVVVDRSLYWGAGSGSAKYGASLAPAVASGQTTQYFSLLATQNGTQSFVTVLNPNSSAATLSLALVNTSGSTVKTLTATVQANARYTFSLPGILAGTNGLYAGILASSAPVVAEASTYSGGSPNIGQHPGLVAQGSAGVQVGAQADVNSAGGLLQIFNPGSSSVRVQVLVGGSIISDGTLASGGVRTLQLSGANNQGVLVLSSGAVSSTLVNDGLGSGPIWGGSLG